MHVGPRKMFEPSRQHPVAALTKAFQILKDNIITILVIIFVGGSNAMFTISGIFGVVALLLIWGVVSWYRFTYQVVDGELHIKQGVLVRKNLYLSGERIQVVDITAGVVQRIFGLVALDIKTAGSSAEEAKISAMTREQAEEIKKLLMKSKQEEETEEEKAEEIPAEVYKLSAKDLVIAASTSGSFGVALSIVATVFSQVDQVISQEEMAEFIERVMPASVTTYMAVYIIFAVVLISWLFAFFGTIIKFYGFTLRVEKDQLIIRHGLFEQKQLTVPFNRIQAIQMKEGLLRQPFGYASLVLESAGYGDQQGNSTTLYPLLAREKVWDFIQQVVPRYHVPITGTGSPETSLSRYLFRTFRWALLVIIPAWFLVPYGEYALLLIIPFLLLGYAQYSDALIGVSGQTLILRFRLLSKTTALVKKKRIQSASISQNPFQKRRDLMSYIVTVASGSQGRTFKIRDLETSVSRSFLHWVSPVFGKDQADYADQ